MYSDVFARLRDAYFGDFVGIVFTGGRGFKCLIEALVFSIVALY